MQGLDQASPRSEEHTYRALSLGAFAPTRCLVIHHPDNCSVFIFLASCRRWPITFLSWSRGSGSQAQAEDLSAQLALIISSQNFLQVLQQHSACSSQDHNPPHPHWQRVPFIFKERTSQILEQEQSVHSKQTWRGRWRDLAKQMLTYRKLPFFYLYCSSLRNTCNQFHFLRTA